MNYENGLSREGGPRKQKSCSHDRQIYSQRQRRGQVGNGVQELFMGRGDLQYSFPGRLTVSLVS